MKESQALKERVCNALVMHLIMHCRIWIRHL